MYRAVQNRSKLFFSRLSFLLISLNNLMQLIELNNNFEDLIYAGYVLKQAVEWGGSPPSQINMF